MTAEKPSEVETRLTGTERAQSFFRAYDPARDSEAYAIDILSGAFERHAREAVAPAVRDLARALRIARQYVIPVAGADGDLDMIEETLSRYRHLIEGEGE